MPSQRVLPWKATDEKARLEDFDDEFINGEAYHYEKPKRGRGSKGGKSNAIKRIEGVPRPQQAGNPLLKYLGPDLIAASESRKSKSFSPKSSKTPLEEEDGDDEAEEDEYESSAKESDAWTDDDDIEDMANDFRELDRDRRDRPIKTVQLRPSRRNIYEISDSDDDPPSTQSSVSKRPGSASQEGPATKKMKLESQEGQLPEVATPADESDTESDEGFDDYAKEQVKRVRVAVEKLAGNVPNDSETESESEDEIIFGAKMMENDHSAAGRKARPDFGAQTRPPWIGPLVLDRQQRICVPGSINRYLRAYQREGAEFFYKQYAAGKGCILGDDMGLGKTIQVISFLSAIMKKYGDERDRNRRRKFVRSWQDDDPENWRDTLPKANENWPTCLIVAPASVVYNWERELRTWGYFEVGIYMGKERADVLQSFRYGRFDILLTSFELVVRDIEELDDLHWSCVIVDEAHRLKNGRSKTTVALDQIACRQRFALTGTAIQNDYNELWTVLDWTNPGEVGTKEQWEKCISTPLKEGQSSKATATKLATARLLAIKLVKELLPHFFIRRTKALIADQMPEKFDMVAFCPLTQMQIDIYERFLSFCQPPPKGEGLKYIGVLMKLSNHVAMLYPTGTGDDPEKVKKDKMLVAQAFPDGNAPKYATVMLDPEACGKLQILWELLKDWKAKASEKNKVLIFSRSVRLIDFLDWFLKRENLTFRRLDGNTKKEDRMELIDEFNNDSSVFCFLISTLAGGVGLNLTAANKVVVFDPNWNPAHDLQAIDRAFRIGQLRDVTVFRLLSAGTIEEHIYRRQIYKQQMMAIGYDASMQTRYFEGIQGRKGQEGDLFGMKNLFSLKKDKLETKDTIQKAEKIQFLWTMTNADRDQNIPERTSELAESKGLLSYWLEDPPVAEAKAKKTDEIHDILSSLGVQYAHQNDEIIKPSRVEAMVAEKAINQVKRRRSSKKEEDETKSKKPEWPPKRKKLI